jgi:hypothetical protein
MVAVIAAHDLPDLVIRHSHLEVLADGVCDLLLAEAAVSV